MAALSWDQLVSVSGQPASAPNPNMTSREKFVEELEKKGYEQEKYSYYKLKKGVRSYIYARNVGIFRFNANVADSSFGPYNWKLCGCIKMYEVSPESSGCVGVDFQKRGSSYDIQKFNQAERELAKHIASKIVAKISRSSKELEALLMGK
jgi:hypothetical protein